MAKRRKRKPSIRANFYAIEKIIYKKRKYIYVSNPKGYLYSGASILVKVTKDNLPSYFVPARYKKCCGYIRTNKVKSLMYLPGNNNHFICDDVLLISYKDDIAVDPSDLYGYRGYQVYIFGIDILEFLKGVNKNSSDLDTSYIENHIKNKKLFLEANNYDVYSLEASSINLNNYFNNKSVEVVQ